MFRGNIKGSVSGPGRKKEGSEENVFQNPWYVNPRFYPGTGDIGSSKEEMIHLLNLQSMLPRGAFREMCN